MKGIVLLAVWLASLSPVVAAQESELGGKVRSGREVTIPATETVQGDLIATGGTVRVDGRVDGDLVASGGRVIVAGTVTGDLLAAAGTTTISGAVQGDARIATGQAQVEGQGRVGEDLLVAAGQATLAPDAQVGGDLIFATGRMRMDGAVAGSVLGSTGSSTGDGSVGGSERVNLDQPQEQQEPTLADRTVDALRRYVSILAVGALLLWLLPGMLRGATGAVGERPLVSFGVGILGFLAVVVGLVLVVLVTVLLAVLLGLLGLGSLTGLTVFGGLLAAASVVFLLVLAAAFAAPATVGLALGRLLVRAGGEDRSFLGWLGALALGVLLVVLVAAIPVAGGFIEALLAMLGLGALLLVARPSRRLPEPLGRSTAG